MMALVCLVLAAAFAFCLRKPIKAVPWLFYLLAIALDVVVIYGGQLGLPQWFYSTVVMANGRCLFAFGLFCVVMFVGVLDPESRVRRWLAPIRAELSIIAAILVVGHGVHYIGIYSPRVISSSAAVANGTLASFAVALVVVCLLALLTVTSFKIVRSRMKESAWKAVQRLAYPFFLLIYLHVLLIVGNSALRGSRGAVETLVVMGVVLAAYVVLRLIRWRKDKAARATVESVEPQGALA